MRKSATNYVKETVGAAFEATRGAILGHRPGLRNDCQAQDPMDTTNNANVEEPAPVNAPPVTQNVEEDCLICTSTYPKAPAYWKTLHCTHKICLDCYKNLEKSGRTISGQRHTFVKCPFCLASTGIEIGSCPNGTMRVTEIKRSAAGYKKFTTLQIEYYCTGSYYLNRVAYVPNTPEGKKVVELLKIAWDRRLCFSIGTSITTGQENVVVWNIHHKTALSGGVSVHGYPDPTYLTRVQQELAQYGIA